MKQYEEAAQEALENEGWTDLLRYNQIMLRADTFNIDKNYQAGLASFHLAKYEAAEQYFRTVSENDEQAKYRLTDYYLGEIARVNGDTDAVIDGMTAFTAGTAPVAPRYVSNANTVLAGADDLEDAPSSEEVTKLDTTFNTGRSDFGPRIYGDRFYMTTSLPLTDDREEIVTIFHSELDEEGAPTGVRSILFPNDATPDRWLANPTFSHDGQRIYYSVCTRDNETGIRTCGLHYRTWNESQASWQEETSLGEGINAPGTSNAQPMIAWDSDNNRELLFWVRNNTTGMEKRDRDIWCAVANGNGWGDLNAVEVLNTEFDDQSPYYDAGSRTVYFSSNGRGGLGGADVFSALKTRAGQDVVFANPVRVEGSVNSSYDDVYYSFDAATGASYVSSNRPDLTCDPELSESSTPEGCGGCQLCHDIYRIESQLVLRVLAFSSLNGKPLRGVTVDAIDQSDGTPLGEQTNPSGNDFHYDPLPMNRNFRVTGTRPEFTSDQRDFTSELSGSTPKLLYTPANSKYNYDYLLPSPSSSGADTINVVLEMAPPLELIVEVYEEGTNEPINGADVRLRTSQGNQSEQDRMLPNTHRYEGWEVFYGRDYTASASKSGYEPARKDFTMIEDSMYVDGPIRRLLKVYLRPLPEDFFPVVLYFENDRPGPGAIGQAESNVDYGVAYSRYVANKPTYYQEFGTNPTREAELNTFFRDSVEAGWQKLLTVERILKAKIENGEKVDLIITASASARSNPEYNLWLSRRRISSIIQHMRDELGATNVGPGSVINIQDRIPTGDRASKAAGGSSNTEEKENIYDPDDARFRRVIIRRPTPRELGMDTPDTGSSSTSATGRK